MNPQEHELKNSLDVLKQGGVILYPTDTIWGLGCDATNANAAQRIFQIKERSESKSMIVLLDSTTKLNKYFKQVPEQAWTLFEFSQKPLTLVLPGAVNLAQSLISNDGTAAVRIVKHEFCRQLIFKLNKPLVSTSANISGMPSPLTFTEIDPAIIDAVDYVVNLPGEKNKTGKPSTIIKLELDGSVKILRK